MFEYEFPHTFLPRRISMAADAAMQAVLDEDAALREVGLSPAARRTTAGRRSLRGTR